MSRTTLLLWLLFMNFQTNTTLAANSPAASVPELKALSHYIGKWDVVISTEDAPIKAKGERTAEWILDGRFVQQTGFLAKPDGKPYMKITTLMTYDQKEKAYRMWTFNSTGESSESSGMWDATLRTMTWSRSRDGKSTTMTANFGENGSEQWTIVTINESTGDRSEFGGTNTRRNQ